MDTPTPQFLLDLETPNQSPNPLFPAQYNFSSGPLQFGDMFQQQLPAQQQIPQKNATFDRQIVVPQQQANVQAIPQQQAQPVIDLHHSDSPQYSIPVNQPIHVRRACVACKAAHARCNRGRPCQRCLKKGIECVEQPPATKKRRRPSKKRKAGGEVSQLKPLNQDQNQVQLIEKVSNLADTTQKQSDVLSKLLKQLNSNATEISHLKSQLQAQNLMLQKLMSFDKNHPEISIDRGAWSQFKDSKTVGVAIFAQGTNILVACNSCFAEVINKKKQSDLMGKHIAEFNPSPRLFSLLADRTPRDIPFNCRFESRLHVSQDIYWMEINSNKPMSGQHC